MGKPNPTPKPHGGARPNAGRKPKPSTQPRMVARSVTAPPEVHARVRALGDGVLSAGYRRMDELLAEGGGGEGDGDEC